MLLAHPIRSLAIQEQSMMPFWQRFGITLVAIVIVSFAAGVLVRNILGLPLPDYVVGVIGGLAALPVWEFAKRVRPK